ncbi:CPBP family intramembrane glutamic endopeptidase [Allostreptomyces psammosilenae]|uniref:Membrane protease YdiL (CAAX protease family) n=1 Tax=Allostreptomyces psammosilenae TaxID=1892865 RepID=A0A852ZRS0_9ACTN|nr:type II CAAX endopeptidase family protein [Allostreptomyces psammosilenae]NYI05136.1 membrane protease YdiL (CAAX protease family) [Allostreptomyces psammosilenae]
MNRENTGVPVFLLLAFGISWASILFAYSVLGIPLDNPLVQLPMGFAPAIAAIVVRRKVTKEGFRDARLAPRLAEAWSSYLLAWLGPPLVLAATAALAAALGLYRPELPADLPEPAVWLGLLALSVVLVPVFWGEEFGWRGYLQDRLGRGPVSAALLTGLIWGVWHYPLAFTGYTDFDDLPLGMAIWTVSCVFQAVILAWLLRRSKSIWVPSLAHAGNNMVIGVLSESVLMESGGMSATAVNALGLVPLGAVAAWVLLTGRLGEGPAPLRERVAAEAGR